jgi:hypothetical protein
VRGDTSSSQRWVEELVTSRCLADLEQAVGVAQEWLYPRDITSASNAGKPNETAEVTRAFEHLTQTGRTRDVFDDFLGKLSTTRRDGSRGGEARSGEERGSSIL